MTHGRRPSTVARPSFADLGERAQVARLRPLALDALTHHPIAVDRLRLLNHGFNTMFRVDTTDGRPFALRLNVNSRRSAANLLAESSWLRALTADTDLTVPVPQVTIEGATSVVLPFPELGRPVTATLFSWLPGRNLGDTATAPQMWAVGRAAATLHDHAARWTMPAGAELPPIDRPLMDVESRFGTEHPLLTPERLAVIGAALADVQARYDELFAAAPATSGRGRTGAAGRDADGGPVCRPLHADLHHGNLKWYRGKLSVFDFDDSGVGRPIQDLAIAAYYLRFRGDPALETAMLDGYASLRPVPAHTARQYEAIVASRNLVLLNDVFETTIPEWQKLLPRYVANSVLKLQAYLDTGVYRHDVPGVEPIG